MIAPCRFAAVLGLVAFGPLIAPSARASGDECLPRWRIDMSRLGDCDTVAALSPGNDTRANLLLLLFDRHGLPSSGPAATAKPILASRDFRAGRPVRRPVGHEHLRGGRRPALP